MLFATRKYVDMETVLQAIDEGCKVEIVRDLRDKERYSLYEGYAGNFPYLILFQYGDSYVYGIKAIRKNKIQMIIS